MSKRILLGGLLAALALYMWESVAHMALPLGEAGIRVIPNEQPVLAAIKANVKESGFYFFPTIQQPGMTEAQNKEAEQRMLAGPAGIMIVHPNGDPGLTPGRLIVQFVFDLGSMLLAGFLLSKAVMLKGYGSRVAFVAMLAAFPTLRTELPQLNWYGFPAVYTASQFTLHLVGFIVGGLILAKFITAVPE